MDKIDYKKAYKELYAPGAAAVLVDVGEIPFIAVDGEGAPDGEAYQEAVKTLYSLSYTIKMGLKAYPMYHEYAVPPLESFWTADPNGDRNEWRWTALIRVPEFITADLFRWAKNECARKKADVDVSTAQFIKITEGLCVHLVHTGAFSEEPESIAKIDAYIAANDLEKDMSEERRHHEIYLTDPRKVAPEKMKTILRIPVKKG
jgi:hypothetical protein